ncbi:MAG: hypothetical protein AAB425_10465, partial [Bdellovibrionota bacterium]
ERCEIFTDVDGVFSADPTAVPMARLYPQISVELMHELALRGAGVLHHRCVQLAQDRQVRLWVRNSLNQSIGTEVITTIMTTKHIQNLESTRVIGVTADENSAQVRIEFASLASLNVVWHKIAESGLAFVLTEMPAPQDAVPSKSAIISLFVGRDALPEWQILLETLQKGGSLNHFHVEPNLLPVSVVGLGIGMDAETIARAGEALVQAKISARMVAAGVNVLTFAVQRTEASKAVLKLHQELVEQTVHR